MLKLMRDSFKHLKWILMAVVAAFVFGFVFIDMGLSGGTVGRGDDDNRAFAARVNGETISYNDYYRALKRYEDMYRERLGGQPMTPEIAAMLGLPNKVMEALIDQRLLLQEASRMNLDATPEEVRKKLLSLQIFTKEGKFVGMELYNRYVTGPLGYPSAADFERDLAREIQLGKIDSALTGSVVVSPKAAEVAYRRANENAKIRYVLLSSTQQAANVTVTPAEVEAYYRNNQHKYTHGEQRFVRYLLGDLAKLRTLITPSEAELRKRYEAMKDQYQSPDSAHVHHILVQVPPNSPPGVDAAAKAKAQSLVAQLRAGADFPALAQANSDDPSSSGQGGDMQFVDRGQTVEAFEQAIFSIPLNAISDPIRTPEYGYHIVKVTERRPSRTRPFEEVRAEISSRMITELAQEQARNEVTRLHLVIQNAKPKTAAEFAKFQNDKVTANETGWFSKNDTIPGLGKHEPLIEWAFSKNANEMTVKGTPRGPIIAWMENLRPAGVSSLAEVRAKVEEDARQAKAAEASRSMLAQIMSGATSIDQVAQKAGVAVREATASHEAPITGLTGDTTAIVEAALAASVGDIKGPLTVKEGAIAFQVVEQKKVTSEEFAQKRTAFVDNLRQQQAGQLRSTLLKRLRKGAKVEVNEELLKPPAQQAGL